MNILIFVLSLVMLLAVMTYGRLDMYRNFFVTQGEFERYIVNEERKAINLGAEKWYKWTHLVDKNGQKRKGTPSNATPYISIFLLMHPEARQANNPIVLTQKELLKRLIYIVFGQQKEFQEAVNKNPNIIDELIHAIEMAGTKLTQENRPIKKISELMKLELGNPALDDLYYWMVKGYKIPPPPKVTSQEPILKVQEDVGTDSEESPSNQAEDYFPQPGVISLLDFITIHNKPTIRIYLASPQVLMAIFSDPHTVDDIIKTRQEIYYQMRNDGDGKSLSEQFKEKFVSRTNNIPENMLDFTVSSSPPKDS